VRSVKWLGKEWTAEGIQHDHSRIEVLGEMRRPETGGELMSFLAAVNWMRNHLPDFSRVAKPLQDLLQDLMKGR
jgi:hypothetical protein